MTRALLAPLALGALALTPLCANATAARPTPSPVAPRAHSAARSAAEFFAPRGLGMECGMYLSGVHCQSMRAKPYFAQVAELTPRGTATFCASRHVSNGCNLGNAGEGAAALGYGGTVTVGVFRCTVLHRGLRCTVSSSGKGFLMTRTSLSGVGGARTRSQPLHLQNFLSPDRKVWCGMGEPRSFCASGLANLHQSFPAGSAQLEGDGKVTICFIAHESEAPRIDGNSEGCVQNWDEKAPVLRIGQQSESEGVLCTSAANGITCLQLSGAHAGDGFRVSASEAVEVSEAAALP